MKRVGAIWNVLVGRCHGMCVMTVALLCCLTVRAQTTNDSLQLMQLRKGMYYHYSKRNTKEFFEVTDQLKALAQKLNNEKEFYKAYGNQAIFTSSYINRGQSIEMAKELFKHAEQHDSQYGRYTANYVLGTIYSALAMLQEAISYYEKALDILQNDFPDESRSALYLAMTKADRALGNKQKVNRYLEYVMADPKATMQHKLTALSYRYLVLEDQKASENELDKAYAEREKIKAKYGHDDNFGYIIDFEHALLHKNFMKAKETIDALPETQKATKLLYYSKLAYNMQNYKQAYDYHLKYKQIFDSLNNDNVRKNSLDMGMMLDKARAENEVKDLQMANQELQMKRIASELKNKDIQEKALSISLAYQESRLHEMEVLRMNDSLMAGNKELELSQYRSQVEAYEHAERTRRLKWAATGTIGLLAFVFIGIYALNRRRQLKQLKEAYDKLEETTIAKERIESELSIARDIQMAMVPHDFPNSKRLDIYASMTPAKQVGGDLYDFVAMGDKLYFCLGDVSGKGVPAALFMAMSARLFRTLCKYHLSPALIANAMNNELALNNENGMFVTMFIGLLDLNSGSLDFCNAGHNPPLLDGEFMEMEPNAPLGLWEGLEFVGESLPTIKGKQFFIYSDGLNEAENSTQEQYGNERLQHFLKGHLDLDPHALIDLLKADVAAHVNGADPSDDLTMLCLCKK